MNDECIEGFHYVDISRKLKDEISATTKKAALKKENRFY